MGEMKLFYCLRCQHRFAAEHAPRIAVERSCPACGSNSVRLETPIAATNSRETRPATPRKE